MRFCQMDLGASAWRWDRLTEEDWRFGTIDEGGDGQASDGIMASVLQDKGWKVRCLPSGLAQSEATSHRPQHALWLHAGGADSQLCQYVEVQSSRQLTHSLYLACAGAQGERAVPHVPRAQSSDVCSCPARVG